MNQLHSRAQAPGASNSAMPTSSGQVCSNPAGGCHVATGKRPASHFTPLPTIARFNFADKNILALGRFWRPKSPKPAQPTLAGVLLHLSNAKQGRSRPPHDSTGLGFSSSLLGRFGAGAQKHFLSPVTSPQPSCPLYLHVNRPFSITVL